jgi:hypothetical protein
MVLSGEDCGPRNPVFTRALLSKLFVNVSDASSGRGLLLPRLYDADSQGLPRPMTAGLFYVAAEHMSHCSILELR